MGLLNCFSKPAPGFTSGFFQPPSRKAPAETQDCQEKCYEPRLRDCEISVFENSDEFEAFKKDYIASLDCLSNFASSHPGLCDADKVKQSYETLKSRLFDTENDFFQGKKHALYGVGKHAIDELASLVHNDQVPLKLRIDTVAQLALDVLLCPEGAAVNMALGVEQLTLRLGGDEIQRFKQTLLRQFMLEYAQKYCSEKIPESLEIHYVMLLNNALADKLGLLAYEDANTDFCDVTPAEIEDCLKYILKQITPAGLTAVLADECLSEFEMTMRDHFAPKEDTEDTSTSFSYQGCKEALEDAMVAVRERCGDVGLSGFIVPMDDSGDRYCIRKDATLIALEIMESLDERALTQGCRPKTLARHRNTKTAIEHYGTQLIWAKEDDVPCLFTAKHLQYISRREPRDVVKFAVGAAIKNSASVELLDVLPSRCLSEADMGQLMSKMLGENFLPFLEKHQAAIQKLAAPERLVIAQYIVASGDVSLFKTYMADNRDLFGKHKEAVEILSLFWRRAAQSENVEMLHTVADFAEQAITPSMRLSQSFMVRMEEILCESLSSNAAGHKEMNVASLFRLGTVLTKAWENKVIPSDVLAELLAAKDGEQRRGFAFAMARGNSEQVNAFGNVLLQAADKGALHSTQLFTLLEGVCGGYTALSFALNSSAATVTAFGKTVLSACKLGFLNAEQVGTLMACRAADGQGRLLEHLWHCEEDVAISYGNILLTIDAIKAPDGGAVASTALLAPTFDDYEMLCAPIDDEEMPDSYSRLLGDIKSFRSKVASGLLSGAALSREMEKLRFRVCWGRIDLFVAPKLNWLRNKTNEELFFEVMREWGAVTQ